MADDMGGPQGLGGTIPYFFFDIFAHILPGAFLIASVFLLFVLGTTGAAKPCEDVVASLRQASVAGPAVGFLVFLMAAYFVGFFLGAGSYAVEWIWNKVAPYSLDDLGAWLGSVENANPVESAIAEKLGITLVGGRAKTNNIVRCSGLCWNFVSARDPKLGIVITRLGAETLLSRSVLFASVGLAVWCALVRRTWPGFAIFAVTALAAFFSFKYHRKKGIFERFAFFHVTSAANRSQ